MSTYTKYNIVKLKTLQIDIKLKVKGVLIKYLIELINEIIISLYLRLTSIYYLIY